MDKDKKLEIALLLNELFIKSEEDFIKFENKIKEAIQEP